MSTSDNPANLEGLEIQALEQRNHLHHAVGELRSQVSQARHDLDPAVNARKHFVATSIAVSLLGLVCGYGFGGFFTS